VIVPLIHEAILASAGLSSCPAALPQTNRIGPRLCTEGMFSSLKMGAPKTAAMLMLVQAMVPLVNSGSEDRPGRAEMRIPGRAERASLLGSRRFHNTAAAATSRAKLRAAWTRKTVCGHQLSGPVRPVGRR
jgi:hypothetical protein